MSDSALELLAGFDSPHLEKLHRLLWEKWNWDTGSKEGKEFLEAVDAEIDRRKNDGGSHPISSEYIRESMRGIRHLVEQVMDGKINQPVKFSSAELLYFTYSLARKLNKCFAVKRNKNGKEMFDKQGGWIFEESEKDRHEWCSRLFDFLDKSLSPEEISSVCYFISFYCFTFSRFAGCPTFPKFAAKYRNILRAAV